MLIRDCMTRHPVLVTPTTPASEAQQIMAENQIRHLPVVASGKRLVGLVTRQRLALKPDAIGSLSVWEITRFLANVTVKEVMLRADNVHTVEADCTVEQASALMCDHKIGCLPVVEDGDVVVGIVSEIDIMRSLQEMLGLPHPGVRATVRIPNRPGQFIRLLNDIGAQDWAVMGVGAFPTRRDPSRYDVVVKIPNVAVEDVVAHFEQMPDHELVDIRAAMGETGE